MTRALEAALELVRRACCPKHVEEIEGDLIEIHRRHRQKRSKGADLRVLWEALRSVIGRPSPVLQDRFRRLALVSAAFGALLAYVAAFHSVPGSIEASWQLVAFGTMAELLFWVLLFTGGPRHAR